MTRDEFYAMPRVLDCFPLTFESGNQRWTTFTIECTRCDETVAPDDTRGFVVPLLTPASYRCKPTVFAYHVTAQGLCQRCKLLHRSEYTLHEDMTLSGRHPKSGVESRWRMRRLTWWERLRAWLSS